jgi:hypothetical protein
MDKKKMTTTVTKGVTCLPTGHIIALLIVYFPNPCFFLAFPDPYCRMFGKYCTFIQFCIYYICCFVLTGYSFIVYLDCTYCIKSDAALTVLKMYLLPYREHFVCVFPRFVFAVHHCRVMDWSLIVFMPLKVFLIYVMHLYVYYFGTGGTEYVFCTLVTFEYLLVCIFYLWNQ